MKLKILFFTLLVLLSRLAFCQEMVFEGLKRTKVTYLQRIIGAEMHDPVDSLRMEKTIQNLRNTQLFSHITYRKSIQSGDTVTILTFSEVRSLLPIAELGVIKGNQWFRLGIKDENGNGRGIKTVVYYQYTNKHSFYVRQNFPLVLKSWGIGYVLRKWSFLEPFRLNGMQQYYVYNNNSAEVSFNYPFAINKHDLELGLGFMKEKFTHNMPEQDLDAPQQITQTKMSFKAVHNIRRMNYNVFYQQGWANTFSTLATYEINLKQPFVSLYNDLRFFRMLPFRTNLAIRNRLGISTNSTVFFAPFVLDSYYNVRGVGNRVDRGTASIVLNTELRKTVWENKIWGLQAVGFCDSGSWRKPGGRLTDISKKENVMIFAGLGSRLIYKKAYDVVFRLDYGWKIHGIGRGFVFGIGQYF